MSHDVKNNISLGKIKDWFGPFGFWSAKALIPTGKWPGVTRTRRKWHKAPLKHWEGGESWGMHSHHQRRHHHHFYFKTKTVLEKVTTVAKMCQRGSLFSLISIEVWDWGKWKRPFHNHLGLFRLEHVAGDKEDTYSAIKIFPSPRPCKNQLCNPTELASFYICVWLLPCR